MLTFSNAATKILAEYDAKRSRAEANAEKRRIEVAKAHPDIAALDAEITQKGLDAMGKILSDKKNADKHNHELANELERLCAAKNALLVKYTIDPDYDKPKYACSECGDTGFVGNLRCRCYTQQLINYAYEISNMSKLIENQSFDSFDLSYYSDTAKTPLGITERENMEEIFGICTEFCRDLNVGKNLLFYGEPGLGKTFMSSAIAKELLDKGNTVIYTGAARLFSSYEDYRFGRMEDTEDWAQVMKLLYEADLLIIDDLGVEMKTQSGFQFLFDLLNDRILNKKKIIINTNLDMEELTIRYTPRITSRIYENFTCLRFSGKDIRIQKLTKNSRRKN